MYRPTYLEMFSAGVKKNGSFTGAVGLIERNEVDFLAMESAMTLERSEVTNSLMPTFQAE